ncbi:hypothetical protein BJ742DRAFT_115440 [Cladochytrium replicatum]|nr:hypothetical protein BJ742DRAFT_115440 [Cladochytrium replicatum]
MRITLADSDLRIATTVWKDPQSKTYTAQITPFEQNGEGKRRPLSVGRKGAGVVKSNWIHGVRFLLQILVLIAVFKGELAGTVVWGSVPVGMWTKSMAEDTTTRVGPPRTRRSKKYEDSDEEMDDLEEVDDVEPKLVTDSAELAKAAIVDKDVARAQKEHEKRPSRPTRAFRAVRGSANRTSSSLKRVTRKSANSARDETCEGEEEVEEPKTATRRQTKAATSGKRSTSKVFHTGDVVFVDPLDPKCRFWWPAIVVPKAEIANVQDVRHSTSSQLVVRYFEDANYSVVDKVDLAVFDPTEEPFISFKKKYSQMTSDPSIKSAMQYHATGELPPKFLKAKQQASLKRNGHLTIDEPKCDSARGSSEFPDYIESSDDEVAKMKTRQKRARTAASAASSSLPFTSTSSPAAESGKRDVKRAESTTTSTIGTRSSRIQNNSQSTVATQKSGSSSRPPIDPDMLRDKLPHEIAEILISSSQYPRKAKNAAESIHESVDDEGLTLRERREMLDYYHLNLLSMQREVQRLTKLMKNTTKLGTVSSGSGVGRYSRPTPAQQSAMDSVRHRIAVCDRVRSIVERQTEIIWRGIPSERRELVDKMRDQRFEVLSASKSVHAALTCSKRRGRSASPSSTPGTITPPSASQRKHAAPDPGSRQFQQHSRPHKSNGTTSSSVIPRPNSSSAVKHGGWKMGTLSGTLVKRGGRVSVSQVGLIQGEAGKKVSPPSSAEQNVSRTMVATEKADPIKPASWPFISENPT